MTDFTTAASDRARQVIATLQAQGLTLGLAESCTGGLLVSTLTDVPGSSAVVMGGIVSYSNDLKERLLGVPQTTLAAYGAVSAETAEAMALGARERLRVDVALSVTGIAGPGGGTPEKPVGLVYIGIATAQGVRVERCQWQGDRSANKWASVHAALGLVLDAEG